MKEREDEDISHRYEVVVPGVCDQGGGRKWKRSRMRMRVRRRMRRVGNMADTFEF